MNSKIIRILVIYASENYKDTYPEKFTVQVLFDSVLLFSAETAIFLSAFLNTKLPTFFLENI